MFFAQDEKVLFGFKILSAITKCQMYLGYLQYRVFGPDLTYFEDLAGQLKTTFWSKRRYLCIPDVWAFKFRQLVLEKLT